LVIYQLQIDNRLTAELDRAALAAFGRTTTLNAAIYCASVSSAQQVSGQIGR
jgi:hypothetical protein